MFTPPCFTNMKSFIRSEIPHLLTSKAAGGGVCGWRCLLKTKKSAAWETCSCWGNLHVELFSCAQLKCHSMSGLHRWTNKPRLTFWNVPDFFPATGRWRAAGRPAVSGNQRPFSFYLFACCCLPLVFPSASRLVLVDIAGINESASGWNRSMLLPSDGFDRPLPISGRSDRLCFTDECSGPRERIGKLASLERLISDRWPDWLFPTACRPADAAHPTKKWKLVSATHRLDDCVGHLISQINVFLSRSRLAASPLPVGLAGVLTCSSIDLRFDSLSYFFLNEWASLQSFRLQNLSLLAYSTGRMLPFF